MFLGVSFLSLLSFNEISEVHSLVSEVVPLVEPELFFCLDEEPLPDLLSDLDGSDLGLDLFPEASEVWVSWETSPCHSQYRASIA